MPPSAFGPILGPMTTRRLAPIAIVLALLALPAAAQAGAYVAGTGEPAFTRSAQNTHWVGWEAVSGADDYRLKASPTTRTTSRLPALRSVRAPRSAETNSWVNWSGVRTLQHGGQYGSVRQRRVLAPQRQSVLPRRAQLVQPGHDGRQAVVHDHRPQRTGHLARPGGRCRDHEVDAGAPEHRLPGRPLGSVPGQLPVRGRWRNAGGGVWKLDLRLQLAVQQPRGGHQVHLVLLPAGPGRGQHARRPRPGLRDRGGLLDPRQPSRVGPDEHGGQGQPVREDV